MTHINNTFPLLNKKKMMILLNYCHLPISVEYYQHSQYQIVHLFYMLNFQIRCHILPSPPAVLSHFVYPHPEPPVHSPAHPQNSVFPIHH